MGKANSYITELLGMNLRRLRYANGFTQDELAARAGTNRQYVSEIETKAQNVSLEMLERIADALDVDPRELLRPRDEWPNSDREP